MKIAILTSGILPVPAVQGGAAENLIDFYLDYNNRHCLHDITIYSVYHPDVEKHRALQSMVNHYRYFHVDTFMAKIMKRLYHFLRKEEYYHYSIEYFFDLAFKEIKKSNYDIVILENRPYYSLKMNGKIKSKIVCHQHTDTLNVESFKCYEVFNSITRFITVSDFIASRINTINGSDNKCVTVHNGIDIAAFSPDIENGISRADLHLRPSDFIVLYSGRIMPQKGITELIEAINILDEVPNVKLLIIGSSFYANSGTEDDFIKDLKEKASPVSDRIIFTGFIPYQKIPEYLKIVDVAAIPSLLNDAFPTTVLEAQAMGLPIITTNCGGIPEQICEDNAIVLKSGKDFSKRLAKAIMTLYDNPDKCQEMKKISLSRASLFDKEIYAKKFLEAINL